MDKKIKELEKQFHEVAGDFTYNTYKEVIVITRELFSTINAIRYERDTEIIRLKANINKLQSENQRLETELNKMKQYGITEVTQDDLFGNRLEVLKTAYPKSPITIYCIGDVL